MRFDAIKIGEDYAWSGTYRMMGSDTAHRITVTRLDRPRIYGTAPDGSEVCIEPRDVIAAWSAHEAELRAKHARQAEHEAARADDLRRWQAAAQEWAALGVAPPPRGLYGVQEHERVLAALRAGRERA